MEKIKAIQTTYHVSIMYDGWVLMCVLEDLAFRNESDVCFVKNTWNMAMAHFLFDRLC